MFKRMINRNKYYDQETRAHLNLLSEKELLIACWNQIHKYDPDLLWDELIVGNAAHS